LFPPNIKKWLSNSIKGKEELIKTFSLKLQPKREEKPVQQPAASAEQELIFEKENQAVLSSDQREVCMKWWYELSPMLKKKLRNKEAKLIIQGYTTPSGTTRYNDRLAEERAKETLKVLAPKIGVDLEGKPAFLYSIIAEGEYTDNSYRYVKITVQ
jgi:outer membrane protein OmpA-like peptidoglycan-associated protein